MRWSGRAPAPPAIGVLPPQDAGALKAAGVADKPHHGRSGAHRGTCCGSGEVTRAPAIKLTQPDGRPRLYAARFGLVAGIPALLRWANSGHSIFLSQTKKPRSSRGFIDLSRSVVLVPSNARRYGCRQARRQL
jgi:hypothetical protein